jgi:hypothetical protein
MQVIDRNHSFVAGTTEMNRNIIGADLAFTTSSPSTSKLMEKEQFIPKIKHPNQSHKLKIESDAYDMIRQSLT